MASIDRRIEELYARPLGEFTRARNALAAELRSAGRPDDAARVSRLAKPPVPIWAINQLAHRSPDAMARLIAAVQPLKRAQLGRGGSLQEAAKQHRTALRELLDQVDGVLERGGFRASPAMSRRISHTLLGAAADQRTAVDLKRGRLVEELTPPGLDALLGAGATRVDRRRAETAVPASPSDRSRGRGKVVSIETARRRKAASEREIKVATRRAREAEQEAARRTRAAEREAARRTREAERAAGRAAAAARRSVGTAERKAARLRRQAEATDRIARTARNRLLSLEEQATKARRAAESAEAELADAKRALGQGPGPNEPR